MINIEPSLFSRGLHAGWCNLLDDVRAAGLAKEFSYAELIDHLGHGTARPPLPGRFVSALHRFYDAKGDRPAALRRRRADSYAAVRLGEAMNATRWLARLIAAAPALAGITVIREPYPALLGPGTLSPLPTNEGWVELADVVDAVNVLLRERGDDRFVPLRASPDREAYVLADWTRAALLDDAGVLELDWIDAFEIPEVVRAA